MRSTFMLINIEGLCSKSRQYKVKMTGEIMKNSGTVIAALTETHLNEEILDAEVAICGYQVFRSDRVGRIRGGVALYVKDEFASDVAVLLSGSDGSVEYIVLHLKRAKIVVGCIYRPPQSEASCFLPVLDRIKSSFQDYENEDLILCGDFNLPKVDWFKQVANCGNGRDNQISHHIFRFMEDMFMDQVVDVPTRLDNTLDLVFVNNEEIFVQVSSEKTIMSDHDIIFMEMVNCAVNEGETDMYSKRSATLHRFNFNKNIDWNMFQSMMMEVDWRETMENMNATQMYNYLLKKLENICETLVPLKKKPKKGKQIPRDRRILFKKKSRLYKKLNNRSSTLNIAQEIHNIDVELSESYDREIVEKETCAIEAIKDNPRYFYEFAKSKSSIKTNIGPLKTTDDQLTYDSREMAEELKKQYESVYSEPLSPSISRPEIGEPALSDLEVDPSDFVKVAKVLKRSSAPGPDGVPAGLVKNATESLSIPLSIMWNKSMRTGEVPLLLKRGTIIPVFKGGHRCEAKNYRPVALTSHLIKLFERIMIRKLVEHMNDKELFDEKQHGFRSGRSCLSQLLTHHQQIIESLCDGYDVDVMYLDFSKAFDKVSHSILIQKLADMGVSGPFLRWIESFLSERIINVMVNNAFSSDSPVISGVPQGSVLGPLLFLIYIQDMSNEISSARLLFFADDTKIIRDISSIDDCCLMSDELSKLYNWAENNKMVLNGDKFQLLQYTATGAAQPFVYVDPMGSVIEPKNLARDLGVEMSNDANFDAHISSFVDKARGRMRWILRVFSTRDKVAMLTLYNSLVRPIMEYCSQLWHPQKIGLTQRIEAIQRAFTFRISGVGHLNYWDRLSILGMYSLERRRERYIIIYVWRIINQMSPNLEGRDRITMYRSGRRGLLCRVPSFGTTARSRFATIREASFAINGPRLFNSIPAELRDYTGSVDSFKRQLDIFLSSVIDKPPLPGYHQPAVSNSIVEQLRVVRANHLGRT